MSKGSGLDVIAGFAVVAICGYAGMVYLSNQVTDDLNSSCLARERKTMSETADGRVMLAKYNLTETAEAYIVKECTCYSQAFVAKNGKFKAAMAKLQIIGTSDFQKTGEAEVNECIAPLKAGFEKAVEEAVKKADEDK